jgi:lipid-A-disaccharide synthase
MPNLIAGRRIAPELVQGECTPQRIAAETRRLLTDPGAAGAMRQGLDEVRGRLGQPGAIGRAARAAWGMIRPATGDRAE